MNQATAKQHFVPQFYLKEFADNDKNLHVLDGKNMRMAKTRPYPALGYEYFYYALVTGVSDKISQQIEEWFKPIEDLIAKEVPRITTLIANNQHIGDQDRYILAVLISMLWLRSPGMRNQLGTINKELVSKLERFHGKKGSDKYKKENNFDHLKFMIDNLGLGEAGFANAFYNMKWVAFLAKGNVSFITTDSPVVEKWDPPKSVYSNAGFIEREKFFALTPKILLHLTLPNGLSRFNRKSLFCKDDDEAKILNTIIVNGGKQYAYSGVRAELERLLDGRKRPGYIESEYYKRYELAWDRFRRGHSLE